MDRGRRIVTLTLVSMVLYALACVLPALDGGGGRDPIPGWVCIADGAHFTPLYWSANPLLWVSWMLLFTKLPIAKIFTMGALVGSLACFAEFFKPGDPGLLIGSWFWLASILVAEFAAVFTLFQWRAHRLAPTR